MSTHRRPRRTAYLAVLIVLGVVTAALAHEPESDPDGNPNVKVTVTPSDGLTNGQAVAVSGTGYLFNFPGGTIRVCTTGDTPLCSDSLKSFSTGPTGAFGPVDVVVPQTFEALVPEGTQTIDCAVTPCRLVAQMSGSFASHHLSFGGTPPTTAPSTTTTTTTPGSGTTNVVQGSAEPGDSISVSGSGLTPSVSYRLLMGTSAENCRTSALVLGGSVVSSASGTIGPVSRIIPTNSTSGVRFLCWVRVGDSTNAAAPDSLTIV